ncbi:MAG: peroxiredoxin [Gemmatimonadaceae bacterium]|nr:peroxiredoxin [Gemmatimonadaceae bacterium]
MPALDFTLMTDAGTPLSLSSLRGRTVVLYFYPKDDTTGCTIESCEFRDLFPHFIGSDAVILGVSPDDVASHQKFKAKYNLPFTLLVDENHALAEQLGIWVEKHFMGNRYMGVERTTYIIGPDGAVQYVFEKVNPAGHAEEVMAFLRGGVLAAVAARDAFEAAVAASKEPTVANGAKKAVKQPAKKPV